MPARLVYFEDRRPYAFIQASKVRLCATHEKGVNIICSTCLERTDVYVGDSTVCPTCHFGSKFFTGGDTKVRTCGVCGKPHHLNGEGICINCYVEREAFHSEDDTWGTMQKCFTCQRMTKVGKKFCSSCVNEQFGVKICRGCHENFTPKKRGVDNFCEGCTRDMAAGICTSCKNQTGDLDDKGWCGSCEKLNYG